VFCQDSDYAQPDEENEAICRKASEMVSLKANRAGLKVNRGKKNA